MVQAYREADNGRQQAKISLAVDRHVSTIDRIQAIVCVYICFLRQ